MSFTEKLPTEVEPGDCILWGPVERPVLDAFYSGFSLTDQRVMEVQAVRVYEACLPTLLAACTGNAPASSGRISSTSGSSCASDKPRHG